MVRLRWVLVVAVLMAGVWMHGRSVGRAEAQGAGGDSAREVSATDPARQMGRSHPGASEASPAKRRRGEAEVTDHQARITTLQRQVRDGIQGSPERNGAITTLAGLLAEHDPAAGLEWLQTTDPADGDRRMFASLFGSKLAQVDHGAWESMIPKMEAGEIREGFVSAGVIGMGAGSPLLAWQEAVKRGEGMEEIGSRIFSGLTRVNPDGFWEVISGFQSGEERDDARRVFFENAVFEDASHVMALISAVPDRESSRDYLEVHAKTLNSDRIIPLLAAAREDGLFSEVPDAYDDFVYRQLDRSFYTAPGDAARIAKEIGDPVLRERMLRKIRDYAGMKGEAVALRIEEILAE